jgi:hypothetical protein
MNEPSAIRRQKKKQGNEGSITKSVEHRTSGKVVSSAESTEKFKGTDCINPAYVGVMGSVTKNMGNYEAVRVQVSVSLPCDPKDASIRKTFDQASSMVDEFVGIELENAGVSK